MYFRLFQNNKCIDSADSLDRLCFSKLAGYPPWSITVVWKPFNEECIATVDWSDAPGYQWDFPSFYDMTDIPGYGYVDYGCITLDKDGIVPDVLFLLTDAIVRRILRATNKTNPVLTVKPVLEG